MRIQNIVSLAVSLLLILTAACADSETDSQVESSQGTTVDELIEQVRSGVEVPADRSQSFARLENCDLSEEMENRIRAAEERLDELLTQFTDRHPDVIATRRMLDELVQSALSDCVERIQFR